MTAFEEPSRPILCLEHEKGCLYGECIQAIPQRSLYWLRPFALYWTEPDGSDMTLYDLRQGSDLLCPQVLCRPAFDVEVLPVLTQLEHAKAELRDASTESDRTAGRQLRAFIQQLIQAYPEAFSSYSKLT